MRIIADYHTHTRYSHGAGTVAENLQVARALGFGALGIADHGFRALPGVRSTPAGLAAMQRDVRDLNARAEGCRLLAGAECNIVSADGHLDLPGGVLQGLDIVLAGLHPNFIPASWRDGWELIGINWLAKVSARLRKRARELNTRAVVQAVLRNDIDIITHPGWGLDIDTGALARACAARDTAMEINASHGHMTVAYCRIAFQAGALFSLGSDAHRPADVGRLDVALQVARAAGLPATRVINAAGGPGLVRRR